MYTLSIDDSLKGKLKFFYYVKICDEFIEFTKRIINEDDLFSPDDALNIYALIGDLKMVSFFVNQIEYNQDHYASALFNSFKQDNVNVINFLIENGAEFTGWDHFLLDQSVLGGNLEMVKIFLKSDLQSNKFYAYKIIPIEDFVCEKTEKIKFGEDDNYLRKSLKIGCSVIMQYFKGRESNLYDSACKRIPNEDFTCEKIERIQFGKVDNYLRQSIKFGYLDIVHYLIDKGLSVSDRTLKTALIENQENIVHYLLTFYSEEQLASFIKKNKSKLLLEYLSNKQLSKYEKEVNALRMCGIDIYDLIENEKF